MLSEQLLGAGVYTCQTAINCASYMWLFCAVYHDCACGDWRCRIIGEEGSVQCVQSTCKHQTPGHTSFVISLYITRVDG